MIEKITRRLQTVYRKRIYIPLCRKLSPALSPYLQKEPVEMMRFHEENAHIFFGYYDISPFHPDKNHMLACRTEHTASSPHETHPSLEIGYFRIKEEGAKFQRLGQTTSWNWQQGCRLQYLENGEKILFNVFEGGEYRANIMAFPSGAMERTLSTPIYIVSPDGNTGLTLNFSRLHRLRAGYGYSQNADTTAHDPTPEEDGLFVVDMASGERKLLFSLKSLSRISPLGDMEGATHYINHLDFSPSGARISFMHLWLTPSGKRRNRIIICDLNGLNITIPTNDGHASHHRWKSDNEILVYTRRTKTGQHYHLFDLVTGEAVPIGSGQLTEDGHPSFLSDSRILTDTYPDAWNMQRLLEYDIEKRDLKKTARFYAPAKFTKELRCDLHPRLSADKSLLSIDYIKDARRAMGVIYFPKAASC